MTHRTRATGIALAFILGACGGTPPVPDWQLDAKAALERATAAYLTGDARVEAAESARARAAVARTGVPALLARVELARCAARVASLVFEDCAAFSALAPDASAEERAYADYLAGTGRPQDAALLPAWHRELGGGSAPSDALGRIADPLPRLVAAGVLLRSGKADPQVLALAADTASAQGWSRPLLAWLGVQLQRAEMAGALAEAARLRRRIGVVEGAGPVAAPADAH